MSGTFTSADRGFVSDEGYKVFPSDDVDPEVKTTKEYGIQFAQAAWGTHRRDLALITSTRRADYIENRKYAEGKQDNDKYKRKFIHGKDDKNREWTFSDLDFSPIGMISQFRDSVTGYFDKINYEIGANAIDPTSDLKKKKDMSNKWAEKMLLTFVGDLDVDAGVDRPENPELEMFNSMDQLKMIHALTYKMQEEIEMKQALDLVFLQNDWPEIAKRIREDLFDNAIGAAREYVTQEGVTKIRYIDPVNLMVRKTRSNSCKDSKYIGEIREMTIADLKKEAGTQFNGQQYEDIGLHYAHLYNNDALSIYDDHIDTDSDRYQENDYTLREDTIKVRIVDIEYFSTDFMVNEKTTTKNGEPRLHRMPYKYTGMDYEYFVKEDSNGKKSYFKKNKNSTNGYTKMLGEQNTITYFNDSPDMPETTEITEKHYYKEKDRKSKELKRTPVKMIYGCKWIIGTDYAYDYGKARDIPRTKSNFGETNLGFHVYRYSNKSINERLQPHEDALNLNWLKLQNLKSRAKPNGVSIEIDALENMNIAGKDWTPLRILGMYEASGNLVHRAVGYDGTFSRHAPIQQLQGGIGTAYQELIEDCNWQIEMMRTKSGINEIFAAATPDPEQSVGGSKLAMQATSNSIQPMLSAYNHIFKSTVTSTARKIQLNTRYKKTKGLDKAIGDGSSKIISIGSDLSFLEMGIELTVVPADEQKTKIEQGALTALNTKDQNGDGQITFPDYMLVSRLVEAGNVRLAEVVLQHRMEQRATLNHQRALERSEAQELTATRASQAAAEATMATSQKDNELAMELETHKTTQKIRLEKEIRKTKEAVAGVAADAGIVKTEMQTESNEEIAEDNRKAAKSKETTATAA